MGNEGNKSWRYGNFPADVREVISVGAVEKDGTTRAIYSGIGWEGMDYIKPDVCAYFIFDSRHCRIMCNLIGTQTNEQKRIN